MAESESAKVKFPKRIKFRGRVFATIYAKTKARRSYRVAWQVAGQRHMASFRTYSESKRHADGLVKDLAKGSQVTALNPAQARDALAALERLTDFYRATGRRVSLLSGISEFAEASAKLNGRNLGEVVTGYLNTVASVKRKDVAEAVEEFIAVRKPLTEAKAGKRAQLSKNYAYMVGLWLRDFAKTFSATAVCDLGKEHLNLFMQKSGTQSPKSRNHYRGAVKMFLKWCVKRDFLSPAHRLFEADSMATEAADMTELEYYRPEELQAMLQRAGENLDFKELLPVIALGGLAGLRLEEILRLEWADIWRVAGHVEIKAQKAKTRSRRLVEICPALSAWLEPYREFSGVIFPKCKDMFHADFVALRESLKIPARRNGLRHAFCTYHFSLHTNENLTAAQAGNSPAMIHAHYKGLATRAEAEKWFNALPPDSAKNVIP
ncbi:MAG: tyrosine-type recombinase/integrase, partial [Limisphaerales bacterium]